MTEDRNTFKTEKFEVNKVENIKVWCRVSNIKVVGVETDYITISWSDTKVRNLKLDFQNNELLVKEKDLIAIYEFFGLIELTRDKEIKLEIPYSYKGKIILETTKEEIFINNLTVKNQLCVTSNTGNIKINDSFVNMLNIKSNYGNTECINVNVEKGITIHSVTGNINCNINGKSSEYKMNCNANNGRCDIKEYCSSGAKIMDVFTNTGKIKIDFIN